ncbi:hypothetical protein GN244_ATG00702 [Phytophthora infestans]|uniref:BZIP domain-containing protein n=1 Tax=Phytophthora infestans TaxID=4787 RepID=A0A833TMQ0_PHYIN|nr:hypothetical protein GN244_ATG00702 [Phytophthora infestans]
MWLNWKNPNTVLDLCAETESGSALEMRRQKNRESMRRSRQRQRDQLQLLRDAVAGLEEQYKSLRLRSDSSEHLPTPIPTAIGNLPKQSNCPSS